MRGRSRSEKAKYASKSPEQIRIIARDVRHRLGISKQYAPDLWAVLLKLEEQYPGFKLKSVPDSHFPHFEAKTNSKAFVLKIRESFETALKYYGDARARFTVAHELGHLFLSHPGNQPRVHADNRVDGSLANPELEKEANIFASEFLMPSDLVDLSMSADEISRRFQVSHDAAALRSSELKNGLKSQKQPATISSVLNEAALVKKEASVPKLQPLVFVSMAFTREMDRLYSEIFKPTIESLGLRPLRADEITSADSIFSDIRRAVDTCALVLAEISDFNPNVMHEIGLAQSIDKPTIIICRSGYGENQIPSNIRHIRRIMYPNDAGGGPILRRRLKELLAAMVPCL